MAGNRLSPGQRAKRVGDQIQRELSDIFRQLRDPRLSALTVMSVNVSGDLSLAKVYVVAFSVDDAERENIEFALAKAAGHIRTELGQRLSIYTTPKLQFIYDESLERGIHLSRLIDEANASFSSDDEQPS